MTILFILTLDLNTFNIDIVEALNLRSRRLKQRRNRQITQQLISHIGAGVAFSRR